MISNTILDIATVHFKKNGALYGPGAIALASLANVMVLGGRVPVYTANPVPFKVI